MSGDGSAGLAPQCARTVLMVRPASFYANPETLATNAFQNAVAAPASDTLMAAQAEFDRAADALAAAGVEVAVASADAMAETPRRRCAPPSISSSPAIRRCCRLSATEN